MELKAELNELDFNNPEQINSLNLDKLLQQMIEHIGTVDPELRDNLIYNTFGKLILQDFLTTNQMEHILEVCLDEKYLFFRMGEVSSDSVFTRSFSALVIALILEKDREDYFLPKNLTRQAIKYGVEYLQKEKDTRGYVEEKGWAHSIAHGADLLAEAIRHPSFELDRTGKCLETIKICLFNEYTYIDDEDERLIFAVEALLNKGIHKEVINTWIFSLSDSLESIYSQDGLILSFFRKKTNVINFIKSLYFRLKCKNADIKLLNTIEEVIATWHQRIYG